MLSIEKVHAQFCMFPCPFSTIIRFLDYCENWLNGVRTIQLAEHTVNSSKIVPTHWHHVQRALGGCMNVQLHSLPAQSLGRG
jgi:hypothetical protein